MSDGNFRDLLPNVQLHATTMSCLALRCVRHLPRVYARKDITPKDQKNPKLDCCCCAVQYRVCRFFRLCINVYLYKQPSFFLAARKLYDLKDASLLMYFRPKPKIRRPNEEVLGLLEQMREDGAPPDSYTYVGVVYGLQVFYLDVPCTISRTG